MDRAAGAKAPAGIDWAVVLRQHDRWLRTVVLARLREPAAVEDVMQELALAAVRETAPPRDPAKLPPWLYRVAVRQALLYRRKAGRRRKLHESFSQRRPTEDWLSHDDDPLAWLLAEERRRMVRTALAELPPRDAEMLLLKYSENWNYRQLAEHLGISEIAVEARLHRARQRLRTALAAFEPADSRAT